VNPTQFNNPIDLEKYPQTIENDILLLENVGCDAVFIPTVKEIYPDYPVNTRFIQLDLQQLDKVMEGKSRPGHFDGVVNVVYRLFTLVQPNMAFFGQKDFQQVSIIQYMIKSLKLPIQLVIHPTVREHLGLAMSSRNMRLNDLQKQEATYIYKTLLFGKSIVATNTPKSVTENMIAFFNNSTLKLDYLTIVHPETLIELADQWVNGAVCCIAAYCNDVRLIDNICLID
jgi:pantoate--beta-alanine ligase